MAALPSAAGKRRRAAVNTAVLPLLPGSSRCRLGASSKSAAHRARTRGAPMDLYVIPRRTNWDDAAALETTAAKSSAEGEKMSDEVRWIRSYVVEEEDGKLGTT